MEEASANPASTSPAGEAAGRVHEYKSLLLLAVVMGGALLGGWYAVHRDAAVEGVPGDEVRVIDKDNTVVVSAGTALQIQKAGASLLVRRYESPEESTLMRNVRKVLASDEAAAGFGFTALQVSTLRTMDFASRPGLTAEQTEAVKAAFLAYSAATATGPASASAPAGGSGKAEAEKRLLAAVAAVDAEARPWSVKLQRIRRIVTPEQFDALCGKKPLGTAAAGSTQPAATRGK